VAVRVCDDAQSKAKLAVNSFTAKVLRSCRVQLNMLLLFLSELSDSMTHAATWTLQANLTASRQTDFYCKCKAGD